MSSEILPNVRDFWITLERSRDPQYQAEQKRLTREEVRIGSWMREVGDLEIKLAGEQPISRRRVRREARLNELRGLINSHSY